MKVTEKINTHILWLKLFFRNSCLLWDDVEKYGRTGQATDNNTASALGMLNNAG
jgi:hypothetical protein